MSRHDTDMPDGDGEAGAAARLVVDLSALAANWRAIASGTAAEVAGVVKANGYGLGAARVARALHAAGCRTFFTAFTREAVELRRVLGDVDIFVLMPCAGEEAGALREHRLVPCLFDLTASIGGLGARACMARLRPPGSMSRPASTGSVWTRRRPRRCSPTTRGGPGSTWCCS